MRPDGPGSDDTGPRHFGAGGRDRAPSPRGIVARAGLLCFNRRMKVLGIDPGLADLGWGVIEKPAGAARAVHVAHGVIRTAADEPMAARLARIHGGLQEIIRIHAPDAVAVEELFFASNVKTAIVVAQARGAAILATAHAGLPLGEYSPPRIKLAVTGQGRASKRQVQMLVRAVLGLKEIPKPDHAADALAVALCHLHSMGMRRAAVVQESKKTNTHSADLQSRNKELLGQMRSRKGKRR